MFTLEISFAGLEAQMRRVDVPVWWPDDDGSVGGGFDLTRSGHMERSVQVAAKYLIAVI